MEKIGSAFTKYKRQRYHSKIRGIEFKLTYDEWVNWWGEDIHNRGRGMGKLQMCRNKDQGSYELGNIFKSTHEQNMKDKKINGTHSSRPKCANQDCIDNVVFLLKQGSSTRQVAKLTNISQRTVVHIKNGTGAYQN